MVPRSEPEKFFFDHFAKHMMLANSCLGKAERTHRRGNVLDSMLLSSDLGLTSFDMSLPGVGGSDHCMLSATIKWVSGRQQLCPNEEDGGSPSNAEKSSLSKYECPLSLYIYIYVWQRPINSCICLSTLAHKYYCSTQKK